ncbi:MAG: lytic transglycosylase domain-containing protein [Marinibacterium sp.]|nr:lytic transglycosylase domain-containing protein [Marinibacterium sp.]
MKETLTRALALYATMFALLLAGGAARAEPPDRQCSSGQSGHVQCIRTAHPRFDTCQAILAFARQAGLDAGFFTRLIWQESRFDAGAVSPANAQGIAQFIPSTAQLRGLEDPFNPARALEASALYLAELTARFGNPGLAAVAYNGGENRAARFVKGAGLPRETRQYVTIITGHSAETWRDAPPKAPDFRLSTEVTPMQACMALARKGRVRAPTRPSPTLSPWGVQVAWGASQAGADAALRRRSTECRALEGMQPVEYVRQTSRVPGRRSILAVRIGRDSRRAADLTCRDLRRAGCACAVYRNR